MEPVELRRVSTIAAELDRLVPRIGEAMKSVEAGASKQRLVQLLKQAERFFLDTGPTVTRARFEPGPTRDMSERFMRELPRRLRMIREASADTASGYMRDTSSLTAGEPMARTG